MTRTDLPPAAEPVVVCHAVTRTYRMAGSTVPALRDVQLTLPPGTITALMGPSGSGKSTLLRLLACVDRPDTGSIRIAGTDVSRLSRAARTRLRRTQIGLLHQSPPANLLEYLTVREHLELGAALRGRSRQDPQIPQLLTRLGLADRAGHLPRQLSGGEQQRTGIAFAAVGPPALLVADEPTGQLDHRTAVEVLAALRELARSGVTIVTATHDPAVAEYADRVLWLQDGTIVEEQ